MLIEETTSNTKREIVRVSTVCAKADSSSFEWALKNNPSMSHCALGNPLSQAIPLRSGGPDVSHSIHHGLWAP